MKKVFMLFCMTAALFMTAGCISQEPAVSSPYVGNERASYTGSYSAILNTQLYLADKAVRNMAIRAHFKENQRANRQEIIEYVYTDLYDGKITITLQELNDEQVKVKIRVGKAGNRKLSQELLQVIDEELHILNNN